jgi:tRNA nucleotidyltransferase/poly(A) polymerase
MVFWELVRMVFKMEFQPDFCSRRLIQNGFWAYYSYQTARDMLLRKSPKEINILTNADLLQLSKLFPEVQFRNGRRENGYLCSSDIPVYFYVSDFPVDNTVKIPGILELEKAVLEQAVGRVLFRIDGFFYNVRKEIFHDPLDAYAQLKSGIIQTITEPGVASRKFPTIALETAKIFSDTGFTINDSLDLFLREHPIGSVYRTLNEEIIADFLHICSTERAGSALELLDRWNVFDTLLPEVACLKQVFHDKDHHPEGNAFWHTLRSLKCVKSPNRNLMMAILIHDTGKATTRKEGNGKRFPNHSGESRKIAGNVLRRFHFDKNDTEEILFLVDNHMTLNWIERLPGKSQSKIFSSPYFPNLLELYRADIESGYHNVRNYYRIARMYRTFKRKKRFKEQGIYSR